MRLYCFSLVLLLLSACETNLPFFYDFETEAELNALYWKCKTLFSLSDKHVTSGKKNLKLELYPSPYPGLTLTGFNSDWSGYHYLVFDVYNQNKTILKLNIRIDDKENPQYSDRYNSTLFLNPGANHISISLNRLITSGTNRKLYLTSIKKMILFMVDPKEKRIIYLDNIRVK